MSSKGTVCIVLTGPHRGRRVVMLKKMEKSGLVLITGPYQINGVPLRRINARHLILYMYFETLPQLFLEILKMTISLFYTCVK